MDPFVNPSFCDAVSTVKQKDTVQSTSSGASDATKTGQQTQVDSDASAVQAAKDAATSSQSSDWSSYSRSGSASDSVAGEASAGQWSLSKSTDPSTIALSGTLY